MLRMSGGAIPPRASILRQGIMEKDNGNMMPLPGGAQEQQAERPDFLKGDRWFDEDISGLWLDFTEPYKPPKWTLSHNGVPFANLGELCVITGKSGNGKTSFMSMIMAAILKGEYCGLRYELKEEIPKPVILYIDTEQGKDDSIAIKNRVCSLSGLDYRQPQEQFKFIRMRDTELAEERWRQMLRAVWETKPNIIFMDGMLDIVKDYNSQEECPPIIRKFMKMATFYNASVWCVLHENPTFDKMVGTLGSVLERKVTEAFAVRKHIQDKMTKKEQRGDRPQIYFTVEQKKARRYDQTDWDFEVVNNAEGWGVPLELDEKEAPPAQPKDTENELTKRIVKCLFEFMAPPLSDFYTNIVKEIKKRMHVGETKAKEYFNKVNSAGVFHLPINGRYSLDSSQCDAILNDLPFAPNNETE